MANLRFTPGLCSVTYRALPADAVGRLAGGAGLRGIEWGGDLHAPPGDPEALRWVREATLAAGLTVASYGSYFRAGPHLAAEDFRPVLSAALTLGAPRIRIWAGALGSAESDATATAEVVAQTRQAARMAAEHRVHLGFEFHHGTLTDSVDSTLRLLDAVGEPNVSTYWQPPVGASIGEAVAGLGRLGGQVCALHVFSWWPAAERLPLAERADLWREVFAILPPAAGPMDALLEFVPGDDPGVLSAEAATLNGLIAAAYSPAVPPRP